MSAECAMSSDCALCYVYSWERAGAAAACPGGCGVAAYCGEACRREHWAQGHAARCGLRGWTDRLLQEEVTVLRAGGGWPRHEKECPVCRKEPTVQGQKLRAKELTSPSYACFARMQAQTDRPCADQVLAAVPGTRMEKVGALLLNILAKMRLSGHLVAEAPQCWSMIEMLMSREKRIQMSWKIHPKPHLDDHLLQFPFTKVVEELSAAVAALVVRSPAMVVRGGPSASSPTSAAGNWRLPRDHFAMWQTLLAVAELGNIVQDFTLRLILPAEYKPVTKYKEEEVEDASLLDLVEAVHARLAPQLRHFSDVLAVLCGGNLRQACTFCSKAVTVANVVTTASSPDGPVLFLNPMFQRVYSCGAEACRREVEVRRLEYTRWKARVAEAWDALAACHSCFHLVTEGSGVRCKWCGDRLYCSQACRRQHRQGVHGDACQARFHIKFR